MNTKLLFQELNPSRNLECIFLWDAQKTCLERGKRMMTSYKFSHKCPLGPPNFFRKPWAFAHFLFLLEEELKKMYPWTGVPEAHLFSECECVWMGVYMCVGVIVYQCQSV